jgi:hypothetical protein
MTKKLKYSQKEMEKVAKALVPIGFGAADLICIFECSRGAMDELLKRLDLQSVRHSSTEEWRYSAAFKFYYELVATWRLSDLPRPAIEALRERIHHSEILAFWRGIQYTYFMLTTRAFQFPQDEWEELFNRVVGEGREYGLVINLEKVLSSMTPAPRSVGEVYPFLMQYLERKKFMRRELLREDRPIDFNLRAFMGQVMKNHLTPQEQEILTRRFGLNGEQSMNRRLVADITGIGVGVVDRLEKQALYKLRGAIVSPAMSIAELKEQITEQTAELKLLRTSI